MPDEQKVDLTVSPLQKGERTLGWIEGETWAILPGKMEEIMDACLGIIHHGASPYKELFRANNGAFLFEDRREENERPYQLTDDGVAEYAITGTLSKKANLLTRFSGGTSMEQAGRIIQEIGNDPKVKAGVLRVDSPGGTVDGTAELADIIKEVNEVKPLVTYGDSLMASAAFWIGTGTRASVMYRTGKAGSVGVLGTRMDRTGANEQAGVKYHLIYAGEHKVAGHPDKEMTKADYDYLKSLVDSQLNLFVQAVAGNLEKSEEFVRGNIANGGVFIAGDALKLGMIDAIGGIDTAYDMARKYVKYGKTGGNESRENNNKAQEDNMPEETKTTQKEGTQSAAEDKSKQTAPDVDVNKVTSEAKAAEKDRVMGIFKALYGDEAHDSFIKVVESGVNPDQVAALTAGSFVKVEPVAGKAAEGKSEPEGDKAASETEGKNEGAGEQRLDASQQQFVRDKAADAKGASSKPEGEEASESEPEKPDYSKLHNDEIKTERAKASVDLDAKVREYQKQHGCETYNDAYFAMLESQPELAPY